MKVPLLQEYIQVARRLDQPEKVKCGCRECDIESGRRCADEDSDEEEDSDDDDEEDNEEDSQRRERRVSSLRRYVPRSRVLSKRIRSRVCASSNLLYPMF